MRALQRGSAWVAGLAVATLGALAGPPHPPGPVFPAIFRLKGPQVVPDTTRYLYSINCPVAATWTVGAPGKPAAGNGQSLLVTWGAGPAQTSIEAVCGKVKTRIPVEVVNVTLGKLAAVLGGNVAVRDKPPLRLADTGIPKPAITFTAAVNVNGPVNTPHWPGRIIAGFVQRLMAADAAKWVAKYSGGKPPKIQQSSRNADTSVNPPPRPDCVGAAQTCPDWYSAQAPLIYVPQGNGPSVLAMRDSPSPGWWLKDAKTKGLDLREAHALWQFETYICVQSHDAPDQFFRRAVATWAIDVTLDSKTHATLKVTPNPVQLVADISADPTKCDPPPGDGVNFWLNNVVTFK